MQNKISRQIKVSKSLKLVEHGNCVNVKNVTYLFASFDLIYNPPSSYQTYQNNISENTIIITVKISQNI